MRRLADLSFRHRLTLVMTLTSSLALLMAGAGLLVFEGVHFYGQARGDIASSAEVMGANTGAALAFGDRRAAQETLDALRSQAGIICAGLYDAQARPFAGYRREGHEGCLPPEPGRDRLGLEGRSLILVRPVMLGGERAGTILVRSSLDPLADRLRGYGLAVLLMTLLATGAATLISTRLQRTVSRPILQLADTARAVTRDGDYSRRVPRLGKDELGVLTDDMNAMLARIEEQDAALRAARDELRLWLAAQQEDLRNESAERRRAEEFAGRLVQAVQSSHEMISISDPDDRFLFVNRAFLAAYGYQEEEVLGHHVTLVDSPNNPRGLRLQIERGTRQGGWHGELLNRRKDGTEFPISLGTSVVRDEQGAIVGLLGVARDISERKESERRLRLQEAALAATVDAVMITDQDGTIEWVNPAFTRLTGYSPEEAIGRNPRILRSGAQPREFYEALWRSILEGRVWYGELSNRRKDGSLYTEEMTITPVTDEEGDIAHFAAIKRDISERLALESQLHGARKMEALGQLAGGVAHDFNNLLGVIRGSGELLAARLDRRDPRRERVEQILDAADRAANLTRQLLAFGRRQVLEPRVTDLNAVVAGVAELLRRLVGESVEILVKPGADLGRVRVDPTQVDQVLLNLAANARDAMPRGGRLTVETSNADLGEADCRAHAGARPGKFVRLRVSDTGVGMDEATRSRVFEPFFTTKDVGQGTGLGLATVYGIVKQSGGYLWVDSAPGKGASFEIYLPRVEGEIDSHVASPLPPEVRTPATILLVEDEASLREIAKELLEGSGYAVIAAANAREALALAEQHATGPVHLLLTDVMMPGLSGPALARRIRERWPDVEVLYMSGYSAEAVETQGALEPGTRLLAKPFSLNTLVRSVEEALA
jgi:PAS domain S-box-containing protein